MKDLESEKAELLALLSLPGAGVKKVGELLTMFGSPAGAWEAVRRGAGHGDSRAGGTGWRELSGRVDPVSRLRAIESGGVTVVVKGGPGYPGLLGEIHDPPWALYCRGRPLPVGLTCVALVGSRKATPYGLEVAGWLAGGLARAGVHVISGAAFGVDAAAHRGALAEGGFTTAVLGCGVDVVYPWSNGALFSDIESEGCLLGEYPPGTEPARHHFPARNRVIAGMSAAVIVVEASERSGALLTVDFALSEGREVMAVPGGVFSPNSRGTNALIRNGAVPVTCPEDVLKELGISREGTDGSPGPVDSLCKEWGTKERTLLDAISGGLSDAEGLSGKTGLNAAETVSVLSRMEVEGLVTRGPGGRYYRSAPHGGKHA
ncbi:MAG: DNA-processing protein DprA [Actinobacteria bacterium]|nr:DNA-processing protein DprA [Actinomycetota bacterium]MCG2795768.1 DNA-processing protein DprA [Actinomycetes bacterium]